MIPGGSEGPLVGIFWGIGEGRAALLADAVPLGRAEPYGDFLTHGGHHEHWERLAALGAAELRRRGLPTAPVWSEYEEWPRGRVVHHVPSRRFVVYADRALRHPSWLGAILGRFGLPPDGFDLRGDPHYVSVRRIGPFVD